MPLSLVGVFKEVEDCLWRSSATGNTVCTAIRSHLYEESRKVLAIDRLGLHLFQYSHPYGELHRVLEVKNRFSSGMFSGKGGEREPQAVLFKERSYDVVRGVADE